MKRDYLLYINTYYNKNREKAINIFDTVSVGFYKPWFGMEQEFFIMDKISKMPVEYSKNNKQGKYYCNIDEYRTYIISS